MGEAWKGVCGCGHGLQLGTVCVSLGLGDLPPATVKTLTGNTLVGSVKVLTVGWEKVSGHRANGQTGPPGKPGQRANRANLATRATGPPDVGTVSYPCVVPVDPQLPSQEEHPSPPRRGLLPAGPHPTELIAAERFLHRRLRNRLNDATDGHGLSYAQVEVMLLLEERTNLHAGQMARALGTSRQAVHALLEKLEGAGLVDVLPQQGEARPVALTDLGRRRITSVWRVLDSTVHAALGRTPRRSDASSSTR